MKWQETVASQCRYGGIASWIFGDAEIIWEHSNEDCQGSANILAYMPDGTFVHYEWTYGSCSGCDEWENRNLSNEQIEEEMRRTMAVLKDKETVKRYIKAGSPLSMAGEKFKEMGEAFLAWEGGKKE